jgi:hypothetical protein
MKAPNPYWHARISFIKSILRIVAGAALACSMLLPAGTLLILAELLGIAEELV